MPTLAVGAALPSAKRSAGGGIVPPVAVCHMAACAALVRAAAMASALGGVSGCAWVLVALAAGSAGVAGVATVGVATFTVARVLWVAVVLRIVCPFRQWQRG